MKLYYEAFFYFESYNFYFRMESLKNQQTKIKFRSKLMTNEEFLFGRNFENFSTEQQTNIVKESSPNQNLLPKTNQGLMWILHHLKCSLSINKMVNVIFCHFGSFRPRYVFIIFPLFPPCFSNNFISSITICLSIPE